MNYDTVRETDPVVADALIGEVERQRNSLQMIASENHVSEAVLEAQSSALTNNYAEGYPGARYYAGCEYADEVEELAIERATSYGAATTSTSSLTRARRLTRQSTWRCSTPATRSSRWI